MDRSPSVSFPARRRNRTKRDKPGIERLEAIAKAVPAGAFGRAAKRWAFFKEFLRLEVG